MDAYVRTCVSDKRLRLITIDRLISSNTMIIYLYVISNPFEVTFSFFFDGNTNFFSGIQVSGMLFEIFSDHIILVWMNLSLNYFFVNVAS